MEKNQNKLLFILSMLIFGTIGIFRKYIPLSSSVIAFSRGFIGVLFLFVLILLKKDKLNKKSIKDNLWLLIISGFFIGLNWVFLFESYKYTSVATATLCYYMAPIFVMIASTFLFKERVSFINVVCILIALIGMVFVSGVIETGFNDKNTLIGVIYGLLAALLYASVIILNKFMKPIPSIDKTVMQLLFSVVILIPYILIGQEFKGMIINLEIILLLLIVGVVHTGLAYALYFDSMKGLKTQSIAILSYIDPVVAIILSALILKENMSIFAIIGAVLILGSTFINEMINNRQIEKDCVE